MNESATFLSTFFLVLFTRPWGLQLFQAKIWNLVKLKLSCFELETSCSTNFLIAVCALQGFWYNHQGNEWLNEDRERERKALEPSFSGSVSLSHLESRLAGAHHQELQWLFARRSETHDPSFHSAATHYNNQQSKLLLYLKQERSASNPRNSENGRRHWLDNIVRQTTKFHSIIIEVYYQFNSLYCLLIHTYIVWVKVCTSSLLKWV